VHSTCIFLKIKFIIDHIFAPHDRNFRGAGLAMWQLEVEPATR